MSNDRKEIRKKLEQEMVHVSFSSQQEVLKRTHPQNLRQIVSSWWNKEVTISLVPVGLATLLLISASIVPALLKENEIELPPREIIQVGGNFYWSDLYEEARTRAKK